MLTEWPPTYVLKRNKRARHVSFKITPHNGLECVVPSRFNEAELPSILESKRRWIEKHLSTHQPLKDILPEEIIFRSIDQYWRVDYVKAQGKPKILHRPQQELVIMGDITDRKKCRSVLVDWIRSQAREIIGPWLVRASRETGLCYNDVSIRGQKTLWGSCSAEQVINLNYKLIFLPPELVRHVLIHELCHTVHMNHSESFWRLVAKHDVDWSQHNKRLPAAEKLVPLWINMIG